MTVIHFRAQKEQQRVLRGARAAARLPPPATLHKPHVDAAAAAHLLRVPLHSVITVSLLTT